MRFQELKSLPVMSTSFLKTNEGKNIIWLDYCGYHLTGSQYDLTIPQKLFLVKGRMNLYNEMNKTK